ERKPDFFDFQIVLARSVYNNLVWPAAWRGICQIRSDRCFFGATAPQTVWISGRCNATGKSILRLRRLQEFVFVPEKPCRLRQAFSEVAAGYARSTLGHCFRSALDYNFSASFPAFRTKVDYPVTCGQKVQI